MSPANINQGLSISGVPRSRFDYLMGLESLVYAKHAHSISKRLDLSGYLPYPVNRAFSILLASPSPWKAHQSNRILQLKAALSCDLVPGTLAVEPSRQPLFQVFLSG